MTFEAKAKLGYVLLALLLAAGMAFSVRQLSAVADDELSRVSAEQSEIALVERLRWNGELIVSSGRGYLVSGDPALLSQLQVAKGRFDENVRALRAGQTLDAVAMVMVSNIEQTAQRFTEAQQRLLDARQRSENMEDLVRRFDGDLGPLSHELATELDQFVRHEEVELEHLYDTARSERTRFEIWLDALLGADARQLVVGDRGQLAHRERHSCGQQQGQQHVAELRLRLEGHTCASTFKKGATRPADMP